MAAYNRGTQRFQDGLDLSAGDLNALADDLKAWVLKKLSTLSVSPGGGASGPALASSTTILASSTQVLASAT
jgi:hypothetical protein